MPFNPYPTTADLSREHDAAVRDLADLATLRRVNEILRQTVALLSYQDELQHPERRWNVSDLVDTLQGELTNIRGEHDRIATGPLVVEAG